METAKITFEGISRQLPLHSIPDGKVDELINFRHDNGRLEPVGNKVKKYNLPSGTWGKMWVHDQNNIENYVGLNSTYELRLINTSDGSSTLIKAYSATVSIEFIKRFMVVVHADGMDTFIWKDNTYSQVVLPNRPLLTFFTSDSQEFICDSGGNAEEILAQYYEKINEASNDNYHTGGIMFRAAIKMYDGNYILHTIPEFLSLGLEMTLGPGLPGVHFTGSKVSISLSPTHFTAINTDIYTHVVIFACKNEELYQMDEKGLTDDMLTAAGTSYPILFEDLFTDVNPDFKKLADSSAWYKVHEFVISEIQEETSTVTEEIKMDGFYQDYATRETLPVDQFSYHSLFGNVTFNYNSRLILGDMTVNLGDYTYFPLNPYLLGIGDQLIIPSGFTFSENLQVKLLVTINTEWGEAEKLINVGSRPFFTKDGADSTYKIFTLTKSIVGYPDARATRIEILVQKTGQWYNIKSISLKKSLFGNYSYYIPELFTVDPNMQYDSVILFGFASTSYNYYYQTFGTNFPASAQIGDPDSLYPDNSYRDTNRVQASEVNNPLFFPAENSYQVGTGRIIGISSNSEPLSSGQFGEYPLQVFTTKGIWAMLQGTGDVLFSKIVPSGSEVANEGTILSVGFGVVFATPTGLYLLSGRELTELTQEVKGSPNTDFQSNTNYQFYLNDIRLITGMDTKLSTVDILDYISSAKMGFDNVQKELLVSNPAKNYSYVYGFKTGFWHKIDESFNVLINYYPKLYVLRETGETGIISISDENYTDTVNVLLTTQPIKFKSGDIFKVLRRSVMRCMITPEEGTHAGFYIFASSDLITWQRVKGINHLSGRKRDFLLTRTGGMAKYYIIVFAGQISCDSYIDSLDFTVDYKLNNKLR